MLFPSGAVGGHAAEGVRVHTESREGRVQNGGGHDHGVLSLLGTLHWIRLFLCCQPRLRLPPSGRRSARVLRQERHHLQPHHLCLHEQTGTDSTQTKIKQPYFCSEGGYSPQNVLTDTTCL